MKLAESVSVSTTQGGYSIRIGEDAKGNIYGDAPKIDRIETYFNEYPDHSETSVMCYSGDKLVRSLWDCPVDIIYLQEPTP